MWPVGYHQTAYCTSNEVPEEVKDKNELESIFKEIMAKFSNFHEQYQTAGPSLMNWNSNMYSKNHT